MWRESTCRNHFHGCPLLYIPGRRRRQGCPLASSSAEGISSTAPLRCNRDWWDAANQTHNVRVQRGLAGMCHFKVASKTDIILPSRTVRNHDSAVRCHRNGEGSVKCCLSRHGRHSASLKIDAADPSIAIIGDESVPAIRVHRNSSCQIRNSEDGPMFSNSHAVIYTGTAIARTKPGRGKNRDQKIFRKRKIIAARARRGCIQDWQPITWPHICRYHTRPRANHLQQAGSQRLC